MGMAQKTSQWVCGLTKNRLFFFKYDDYNFCTMNPKLTLIYWKSKKFWLGRLVEHPEIMTQGRTLKELEENIRDAYQLMVLEDVPKNYEIKEITV
jgi:predicted RNase H-like HicB family nuclease